MTNKWPLKYIKDADITIKNIEMHTDNLSMSITFCVKFTDHIIFKNNRNSFKCNICLCYCHEKKEQELIDEAWVAIEKDLASWLKSIESMHNFQKYIKFIDTKYIPLQIRK